MRIEVTEENILQYGLDVITGNHRVDLLARAKEAKESGYELFVTIPDAEGGDTEAPIERNTFDHYDGFPEPDGFSHRQETFNLEEQAYLENPCSYQETIQMDGNTILTCVQHGASSKYAITPDSHAPCLVVDPI